MALSSTQCAKIHSVKTELALSGRPISRIKTALVEIMLTMERPAHVLLVTHHGVSWFWETLVCLRRGTGNIGRASSHCVWVAVLKSDPSTGRSGVSGVIELVARKPGGDATCHYHGQRDWEVEKWRSWIVVMMRTEQR